VGRLRSSRGGALAAVVVCALVVLAVGAAPAQADIDVPFLPDIPTPDVEDLAGKMVSYLVRELFGLEADVGKRAVRWLIAHPVYTDASAFADLNELRAYVTAGAWALLSLVFTVAAFRYWASGLTATGSYEAGTALVRCGAAAGALAVYPQLFGYASVTGNMLTSALLDAPGVRDGMAKLLAAALVAQIGSLGIGMLASIAAVLVLILLVVTKIVLATLLAVLYVAGPLAIALWPLPETAWAARSCGQALGAVLVWPVLWAICFAVFAVMGNSVFDLEGSFGSQLVEPWVTVAALYVAFKLPMLVARQALLAGLTPNVGRAAMTTTTYARRLGPGSASTGRWGMPPGGGGAGAARAAGMAAKAA
jgi:hypothetical protein